jgi:hypothetical protein
MSDGQKLLEKITSSSLFEVLDSDGNKVSPCIIVWSSGAEEQLDAMIQEILSEKLPT